MKQILGIGLTIAALLVGMLIIGVTGAHAEKTQFVTLEKLPLGYNIIPDNIAKLYNISNTTPCTKVLLKPVHIFDMSPAPGDIIDTWQPSI